MLNIVIPMAGKGSRFHQRGYEVPKPLIPIHGRPMIAYVISNIRPEQEHRFIFLCLKEHCERFRMKELLQELVPDCIVISVEEVTEGAACTVLQAKEYINSREPLMIANSDQYVNIKIDDYLGAMEEAGREQDGFIMTMKAFDSKWSFLTFDTDGYVTEVREKEVISTEATTGIYNFGAGEDFVRCAEKMIADNARVNGEFYVAPVYNYLIEQGKKIRFYHVGELQRIMFGLGIPEELEYFLSLPVSRTAAGRLG